MLFDSNHSRRFNTEFFKNPTKKYRAASFWGWNGDLKTDELKQQIRMFKESDAINNGQFWEIGPYLKGKVMGICQAL